MSKVILIEDNGSTQESSEQSVVDAVTEAFAALPVVEPASTAAVEDVVVNESDGSAETLVPEPAPTEAAPAA